MPQNFWRKKKSLLRPPRFILTLPDPAWNLLYSAAADCSNSLMSYAKSSWQDNNSGLAGIDGLTMGHSETPQDSAIERIIPDIQKPEDEEFEGSNSLWREMNETELLAEKLADCVILVDLCHLGNEEGSATLELKDVDAFLRALNSVRLYCHQRLQQVGFPEESPEFETAMATINFFGVVQEGLMQLCFGDEG
ncbi:MAG: DUF2017 family protein [Corynebacterium sp.]|nr:DUF2017 family protein [Corynebacterium sp.]